MYFKKNSQKCEPSKNLGFVIWKKLALSMKDSLYNPTEPLGTASLARKEPKVSFDCRIYIACNLAEITCTCHKLSYIPPFFSVQLFVLKPSASTSQMANPQMKPVAALLLFLNFCMYVIVLGIGGWAVNRAIDHGFVIGPDFNLPAHFSPIYFPMGNAATGFFVTFALIAGVVGVASAIAGVNHLRSWTASSLPSAASVAGMAWTLTLLAMGFACKEIELEIRNARLRTMEAFLIILTVTQLLYIGAIHGSA